MEHKIISGLFSSKGNQLEEKELKHVPFLLQKKEGEIK
jgi:hypothetical protein